MGTILFFVLVGVVFALIVFAIYMLVRILKIYARARRLETMRGYETILYAALQKLSPDRTLQTLIPDPDPGALEEVLLRMGDEGTGEWKGKIVELYRLAGFAADRTRQLHSRSKSRRGGAARRLGRIGDPDAVPALAELLRDPSEEVREAALFALVRTGSREALQAMIDALDSGSRWSQEKVAEAMEEAGDESRRVLAGLLGSDNPMHRAFAAEVIGGIGGDEEAALLVDALADGEIDVRARAADSLGRMRHRPARPALLRCLQDPAWQVRAQAAKALGKVGDASDAPSLAALLRDREFWVRNNAASALREMGDAGEAPLVEMLWDGDRFARETAAQALEEGSIVERLVKDMREGVEAPEAGRIIRRLAEIGSTGTLIQVLSDLQDPEVNARLAEVLAGIGDAELERVLSYRPPRGGKSRG
ncbi:MAG: HEAT repeat domain-containing protein [Actinomycetota bacterium]